MAKLLTTPSLPSTNYHWITAIGAAVLCVMLLVTIGGYWLLTGGTPHAGGKIETRLAPLIDNGQFPPQLALLVLADYPGDQVWHDPLEQKQWDGALAMWLYGPVRSDWDSIHTLMLMADKMAADQPNEAAALLLAAADAIRISPELDDRARAELIVKAGKKMKDIGLRAEAVTEWRQASILAHYSPSLPATYRATLLGELSGLYEEVGAKRLAARAREDSAQVGTASGVIAVPERIVLDTEALPAEPEPLQRAREHRRQVATVTAEALKRGEDGRAYAELQDALSLEGLRHRMWLDEEMQASHPLETQAALLLYHINWLQRERMLAVGIAGDRFPTWAERRDKIEASLNEAWDKLEKVRIEQSIRGGNQERATLAQRDWWATRLLQHRVDRDPTLDVDQVIESMRPNSADRAGGAALRLDWIQNRFWRVPREYVGTDKLPE